jgi:adenylate kinase
MRLKMTFTDVIGLTGSLGSGKTTLAKRLADALSCKTVGFGTYVRLEAQRRELSDDRKILQDLGAELLEANPLAFCKSVIGLADWQPGVPLIIEGIRHAEILPVIEDAISPSKLILVYIEIDKDKLLERIEKRGTEDLTKIKEYQEHSTEIQVMTELPSYAHIFVDGSISEEEQAQFIIEQLNPRN